MVMVLGKPRHPQSAGSVKRTNGDKKDTLVAWLADNDTRLGYRHHACPVPNNPAQHSGIKRSPYSALFDGEFRIGLTLLLCHRKSSVSCRGRKSGCEYDQPSISGNNSSSVPAPSISSVPAPSIFSVPAPPVFSV